MSPPGQPPGEPVPGLSPSDDRLLLVHRAREFADDILGGVLRLPIEKALNLGTAAGFDRAVAALAARLRRAAGQQETDAVRAAIAVLDVNWARTTPEQRRRLVNDALVAAGRATAVIPEHIRAPLGDAAQSVVAATRSHTRQAQGLAIRAEFNAMDGRILAHVVRSQTNFVRDEYGRRLDSFSEQARRIVSEGLEAGLGRDAISSDLEQAARSALVNRSPFYWEVVAGAFIGQGRSFAQMSSYAEAGIAQYRIEAVLDERTTPICRFLHGKTFTVGDALRRFDRLERLERPEDIKHELPWVRERRDAEIGRPLLYVDRHGEQTVLAEVLRSGVGARDDLGEFRPRASETKLQEVGIGFPPFHGLCRSTTLAVV